MLLVRFDNAETALEKNEIYNQLRDHFPKDVSKTIDARLFEILREPYVFTIREMVSLPDFQEDVDWIAAKLRPAISARQVRSALDLLLKTGLLKRDAQGRLVPESIDLTTGPEIRSLAVCLYHKKILEWAAASIDRTPAPMRDLSTMTVNLSKAEFDYFKKRAAEFRSELLDFLKAKRTNTGAELAGDESRALYYVNLQLFNATELPW